jgi:hypothetical protein
MLPLSMAIPGGAERDFALAFSRSIVQPLTNETRRMST